MEICESIFLLTVIAFIIIATLLARTFREKPHKMLVRLIAANMVLDIIAIAIWTFPETQWSIYRLGVLIVSAEAAVAAALFALTLYGLVKRKKWAPILAIILPIIQRVFGTYVFFPSTAISVTTIWSLVIIYFAYKEQRLTQKEYFRDALFKIITPVYHKG